MTKIKSSIIVLTALALLAVGVTLLFRSGGLFTKDNQSSNLETINSSNKDSSISFSTFENVSELDRLENELNSLNTLELDKAIEAIKQETD